MSQPKQARRVATRPTESRKPKRPAIRTTIDVQGARVHNLKNITVELPRDQLTVVTGLSGSGKSSLAFDTIYAEGQRRYMESLSTYAKRFIAQVEKPDVDFVYGLSPVVSIEQKTIARNPRSTVGTLTDVSSYLNLLFATIGEAHCPYTGEPTPVKTGSQILESILALPENAEVELRAPFFQVYGEDPEFIFNEVRKLGCRYVEIDAERLDLTEHVPEALPGDPKLIAVVDRLVLVPGVEKQLKAAIEHALRVGDSLMSAAVVGGTTKTVAREFAKTFGSPTHALVYGDIIPDFFMFNNPESACRTCGGIGTDKQTHQDLLITNPERSIRDGCFLRDALNYRPDNHRGYTIYSLGEKYGFDLDTPWQELGAEARDVILHGTRGEPLQLQIPPDAKVRKEGWLRWPWPFPGIAGGIERNYRRYRQQDVANSGMEAWLDRVMVEHTCPDCHGSRLRATRLLFEVAGRNIDQFGGMNFDELRPFLDTIEPTGPRAEAGRQIVREIARRIDLLLGIGLDYLNFNRASGTLSGGEAQRIRLSTQIGSGLMGMLYVLDEPSIGLHPKDNVKMIDTLRSLRDLGNTVIVVEHDEDTIRAADHLLELGPGPGIHGGDVVVAGTLDEILRCPQSPTGQYLSGQRRIETPTERREINGKSLVVRGCAGEQSEGGRRRDSARPVRLRQRRIGFGQVDARQRDSLQGTVEAAGGLALAVRRPRRAGRRRPRHPGDQHRPVADRSEQPLEPVHLRRFLRSDPQPVRKHGTRQGAGLQAGAIQLQRQGRTLRGMPGRGRDRHQALLHARRGGGLRCLQGAALQRRDAGSHPQGQEHRRRARHVHRGRCRLLRGSAGDRSDRSRCWTTSASAI